jgi:hypothetical protein
MPAFSMLRSSAPFQYIAALPPRVRTYLGVGAAAGGAYGAMTGRSSTGRAARGVGYGLTGGALAAGGAAAFSAMGGSAGLRTLGRNMMRPGGASGVFQAAARTTRSAIGRGGAMARAAGYGRAGRMIRGAGRLL